MNESNTISTNAPLRRLGAQIHRKFLLCGVFLILMSLVLPSVAGSESLLPGPAPSVNATEIAKQLFEQQHEDYLVSDCPFIFDRRPSPVRVVLQIIDGEFHKWEEHNVGRDTICLVLVRPQKRLLAAHEAVDLLERSEQWVEQVPSAKYPEILRPDDPRLAVPPAMPPAAPSQYVPDTDAPDTGAELVFPDINGPETLYNLKRVVTPELVIGTDDRVRVNSFSSTTQYPWWVIGYQSNTFSDGSSFRCTGFLVGPYMAMTTGHCVYDFEKGRFASSASLAPAQSQASAGAPVVRPFGTVNSCAWGTNSAYIGTGDIQYDYAVMFFRDSFAGLGIDTFMPLVFEVSPISINTAGYPERALNQDTSDMWYAFDNSNVQVVDRELRYTADTDLGQSGSPVWTLQSGTHRVVAVHSEGKVGYNVGTRLVSQNRDLIEEWIANQANICPPPTPLTNGVPVTGLSGAQDSQQYFSIEVPAGATDLQVAISGGTGDADLYVRFGALPTLADRDCESLGPSNDETCDFPTPKAGTYYVMLDGYEAYSGVTLVASHTGGCPELVLADRTVTGTETRQSCRITAGPAFTVTATGFATFRAGGAITLRPGVAVRAGGRFRAQIDPSLRP